MNSRVLALMGVQDGALRGLYVGGAFTNAGSESASRVAHWSGWHWTPLGSGITGTNGGFPGTGDVKAFLRLDKGLDEFILVAGDFSRAGGMFAGSLAAWDGSRWISSYAQEGVHSPDGCTDSPGTVHAVAVYPSAETRWIYATGSFESVGLNPTVQSTRIARWDGQVWDRVDPGLDGVCGFPGGRAFIEYDDGHGLDLFVGGWFGVPGIPGATYIARWDGREFAAVGTGLLGRMPPYLGPVGIAALAEFTDANGTHLYAAGNFTRAGSLNLRSIARWEGSDWHDVGGGVNGSIEAMIVFDDGSGPALYIGGLFTEAGGVPANNIAKWDGKEWSAIGAGTNGPVWALAVWDRDGEGPEPPGLYIGGEFTMAGGIPSPYIAKWQGCATPSCYPDCDQSTGPRILDIFDFLCFGNRFAASDPYACDCDTSTGLGVCDVFDFLCFHRAFLEGCS